MNKLTQLLATRNGALLTAGTQEKHNSMTVGWIHLGTLWGEETVIVYLRKTRYTAEFMHRYQHFSINFFDPKYDDMLEMAGKQSGRDFDKNAALGLTEEVLPSGAVGFKEAELIIEAEKIFEGTLDSIDKLEPALVEKYYEEPDNLQQRHLVFVGRVLKYHER